MDANFVPRIETSKPIASLALRSIAQKGAPLIVLLLLMGVLGAIRPSFLSPYSLSELASESSLILLLAIGETIVILLGGVDLSMAAVASLASVLVASLLPNWGLAGLLAVLAIATVIGLVQGFIHARFQVPSFVVTLAGLGLSSGAALAISPATLPVSRGYETISWLRGKIFYTPVSFLCGLVVLCVLAGALRSLPIGRQIYAIGMGETAALLSGIRVARIKMVAFASAGFLAGLTGIMFVARTHGGHPGIAHSLLLPSIAAVVVGGTAITGGSGNLWRTLAGVLIITVLRVGIAVVGLDPGYEPLVYGFVVVVAVALTVDRSRITVVK